MAINKGEMEEVLGRYHDGELEETERAEVEALIDASPENRAILDGYRKISEAFTVMGDEPDADEFTVRRNWEEISRTVKQREKLSGYRKLTYWLAVAAAAILIVFIYGPLPSTPRNDLVIESIECTYASFMILTPETKNGHTIIWIND